MTIYKVEFHNTSTGLDYSEVVRATSADAAREKAERDCRAWFNCGGQLPAHIRIVAVTEAVLS